VYGAIGALVLGVTIDYVLLIGALVAVVSLERPTLHKPLRRGAT
jgi:hypothetical protein